MGFSLTISSPAEEFAEVRKAVMAFLETYGDCEVKIYERDQLIEEDGIVVHGEYGVLDDLLGPLHDPRLSKTASLEHARTMLKWNLVIYPRED